MKIMIQWDEPTLPDDLWTSTWKSLAAAPGDPTHPFHRAVIGTLNDSVCEVRIVILRYVDPMRYEFRCHTDVRSPKAQQVRDSGSVSWLFFDPKTGVQIRFYGSAKLHHDDHVAHAEWARTTTSMRSRYSTRSSPGAPWDPSCYASSSLTETAEPFENFSVISSSVEKADIYRIALDVELRAIFEVSAGNCSFRRISP